MISFPEILNLDAWNEDEPDKTYPTIKVDFFFPALLFAVLWLLARTTVSMDIILLGMLISSPRFLRWKIVVFIVACLRSNLRCHEKSNSLVSEQCLLAYQRKRQLHGTRIETYPESTPTSAEVAWEKRRKIATVKDFMVGDMQYAGV